MLPSWFDVRFLRGLTGVGVVVGAIGAIAAFTFIRKAALRWVLAVIVLASAGGLYYYRGTLSDCSKTCSCKFFSEHIKAPNCLKPAKSTNK